MATRVPVMVAALLAALPLVPASADEEAGAAEIAAALEAAKENRGELEKYLEHAKACGDAEKLAAARFLVANMPGKGYVVFGWKGAKGESVAFDALKYPDFRTAQAAMDALEKEHGTIDYVKERIVPDVETITAEYLIRHTDLAFAAWRAVPAAERAPFDAFLDFILPYRGSEEPIDEWMTPLTERYAAIAKDLGPGATRADLWKKANEDLSRRARFDEIYYLHPTDQSFHEAEKSGMGRCEDLANLQGYTARALGVAMAQDYTPAWAHRDNNHAWTVTLDAAGKGCEKQYAHAAKVYRKTFSIQRGNLCFLLPKGREAGSRWLMGKCYVDVTEQYGNAADVTVTLDPAKAGAEEFAYLCVFNGGEWTPIHWGRIAGGRVTFASMGRNIAYLPAVHDGKSLVPAAPPLVLGKDGTVATLAGTGAKSALRANAVDAGFVSVDTKAETPVSHLAKGTTYTLQRWDGAWKPVEEFAAGDDPREFTDLPADGLYWLVAKDSRKLERIFTIEDGRQRWW